MKQLFADCRHAARLYVRTPVASLISIWVLAVGMACVAAFVSLYTDLILRPHPGFEQSSRIVTYGRNDSGRLPVELIERIAEESTTLEAAAGITSGMFRIGPDRKQVSGEMVTGAFFGGVQPRLALGRGFERGEHEAEGEPVVVISYRYWQQQFDGRADVLGETVEIRSRREVETGPATDQVEEGPTDFRIVGVMSHEFVGFFSTQTDTDTAFWLPVEQGMPILRREYDPQLAAMMFSSVSMQGIGRRLPGVGVAAVARELNGRYPEAFADPGVFIDAADDVVRQFDVLDGLVVDINVQRSTQRQLQLFLGASIMLALVAAANVSLFLLARAPGRRRELGIRMAVGAPLKRLARQLASEAGLLVVVSAMLGLAFSVWLVQLLRGLEFLRQAEWRNVTLLDWRVLAIVGAFLAILTLLVSLAPILGLRKIGIAASSRQVSARAGIAQRIAGSAQIAIAGTLGGAAVAFAWYLGSLMYGYPGYETRDLHVARYSIDNRDAYVASTGQIDSDLFYVDQTRRREMIASLPGVTGVSLASAVPGMTGGVYSVPLQDPDDSRQLIMVTIDSDYVDLLGLTLLHGRAPTLSEPTAVLVNQTLARMLWAREDVVGEQLPVRGRHGEVVGVLADFPYGHPSADVRPLGFAPSGYLWSDGIALVRSTATSAEVRQQLQGLADSGVLELTIGDVTPLAALRSELLTADRARGFITIGAAALVMLLAAFGFYGTQRYLVAAGRHEYAIRASFGAGPRALGRLVRWRGLTLGLPGLALGAMFAFILVAWLRDDFVSRAVSPGLATLWVVAGLIALLLVAGQGPAREAKRTYPAALLRED